LFCLPPLDCKNNCQNLGRISGKHNFTMKNKRPLKNLTLEDLRAASTQAVAKTIEHAGCIQPTFLCYGRDRIVNLNAAQLPDAGVQDRFASTLRLICMAEDAFAAVLILELWASPVCSTSTGIRPSLAPDRQELVMVRIELPGNQGEVIFFQKIRDGNGKARLGDCISQPIRDRKDRFSNLLPATPPSESDKVRANDLAQQNMQLMQVTTF